MSSSLAIHRWHDALLLLGNNNYSTKASQFTSSTAAVIFALIGTISILTQWKRANEGKGGAISVEDVMSPP